MTHKYLEYVDDVLWNKIVTGNNIKKACERFKNDMQRDDFYFDYDKVDKAISFISTLKHYKGEHAGTSFTSQCWQQFIVANFVGVYYSDNN